MSGIGNIRAVDGLYKWFRQRYDRLACLFEVSTKYTSGSTEQHWKDTSG
ncbi:hypothetical protein [Sporosarcina cyprini]|nr:hypothetical protein [Sporosarcina cyprini]MCG3088150.1 hypothetical protein [Sporosarcina cyprini]